MTYSDADPQLIRKDIPQSARIWSYWMGGKDYYEIDRIVGDECREIYPDITAIARQSQQFLARTVTYLTAEAGVRQFIDIGCGLPALYNTHAIAQAIAPESGIVYVDHEPLVLTHARAMLTSSPEGFTCPLDVDFHDTEQMLADATNILDFSKPIAVLFVGVLGYARSYPDAAKIVRTTTTALPAGSYLGLWDGTDNHPDHTRMWDFYNQTGAVNYTPSTRDQICGYFDGLELEDPGVVAINQWRPPVTDLGRTPQPLPAYGALARISPHP
ncbi:SAM-dependent methyltransferase [Nocardia sp. NPDC004654]|uniref:SAM-dependent methyltransferase n=1 Tax=Nocardia sp. NPDC004654 TaxID=3154776 RepID=UPI0033BB6FE5